MKLLFVSAILLAPGIAQSAKWETVVSSNGVVLSVDVGSIVATKGGGRKAWVEFLYEDYQTANNGVKFSRALNQSIFHCQDRSVSNLQQALYGPGDRGAEFLGSVKVPDGRGQFDDVIPESLNEAALEYVCAQLLRKK